MPKRFKTKDLFYGYPVKLITEWCCVSRQTANHWKSGIRKPGAAALKLFILHRDERVLTDEWRGWGVRRGMLCDPEGHQTSQGQLRSYAITWQIVHELMRENPEARSFIARLVGAGAGVESRIVNKPLEAWIPNEEFLAMSEDERTKLYGPRRTAALSKPRYAVAPRGKRVA